MAYVLRLSNEKRETAWKVLERGCDLYDRGAIKRAAHAYLFAANLGLPHAQVNLGVMYDDGEIGDIDRPRARYWYKRAIRQELPEAAYNLAMSYRQQNKHRWYVHWLRRAQELGYDSATEEELAIISGEGRGTD